MKARGEYILFVNTPLMIKFEDLDYLDDGIKSIINNDNNGIVFGSLYHIKKELQVYLLYY